MIGENIKKRRNDLGLTLQQVACQIGITRQTLSRYENGIIPVSIDRVEALAKALHCSPIILAGWEEYHD